MLPHERHEMPPHDGLPHKKHEGLKPHEEVIEWLETIYEKVSRIEEAVKR